MSEEKFHQETLLQTIKARLERNELGDIKAIWDSNGPYEVVSRTTNGLIRYFEPAYKVGFDPYGNEVIPPLMISENKNETNESQ